jgi:hypothetical protein
VSRHALRRLLGRSRLCRAHSRLPALSLWPSAPLSVLPSAHAFARSAECPDHAEPPVGGHNSAWRCCVPRAASRLPGARLRARKPLPEETTFGCLQFMGLLLQDSQHRSTVPRSMVSCDGCGATGGQLKQCANCKVCRSCPDMFSVLNLVRVRAREGWDSFPCGYLDTRATTVHVNTKLLGCPL